MRLRDVIKLVESDYVLSPTNVDKNKQEYILDTSASPASAKYREPSENSNIPRVSDFIKANPEKEPGLRGSEPTPDFVYHGTAEYYMLNDTNKATKLGSLVTITPDGGQSKQYLLAPMPNPKIVAPGSFKVIKTGNLVK
jgi:hypothetical protein